MSEIDSVFDFALSSTRSLKAGKGAAPGNLPIGEKTLEQKWKRRVPFTANREKYAYDLSKQF